MSTQPIEKKHNYLEKLNKNRNTLISDWLANELKLFFNTIKKKTKKDMSDEAKKKYYTASVKNFNRLFDGFIKEYN